ncbi:MAG: hypothetical protein J5524_04075 [Bacteroidaceae bacterium]|nr:hypothetical protein [Bacteroidaceae bacterium]
MKTRLLITLMLLVAIVTGVNAANFVAQIYCEGWATDDASGNKVFDFDASGTLTYTAPGASYVFVRNDETGVQYCTDGWTDFANPVTLVNQNSLSNPGNFEKFYVPSGEHTLYLVDNGNDTFTIAYDKDIRTRDPKTLPYSYGFEDNDLSVDGWTTLNLSVNNSARFGIKENAKQTGNYGFSFSSYNASSDYNQYLFSPELITPDDFEVSFSYRSSAYTESFKVGYSSTTTDVSSFNWDDVDQINTSSTSWTKFTHTFPAGTKYVAINYVSHYQSDLYVDDFAFGNSGKTVYVYPKCVNTVGEQVVLWSWPLGGEGKWTKGIPDDTYTGCYRFEIPIDHNNCVACIIAETDPIAWDRVEAKSNDLSLPSETDGVLIVFPTFTPETLPTLPTEITTIDHLSDYLTPEPTEDVEVTLKTGMTPDDFTQEQQVAIGAVCTVALISQGTADAWSYSTIEGKKLFEMSKTDGSVKVYDGVSEADNFTYELTEEDRNTLSGYFSLGGPSLAESLASVKTITVQFVANEPAPGLAKDEEGNYLIASADDWKSFAEIVKAEPTANVKMTEDIDLGDDQTMAGTEEHPYQGTFDGGGHTLNVNYDVNITRAAPFRFITNATIRNLHVTGSLTTTAQTGGGIVSWTEGTCLIEKCYSSVVITANKVSATADTYGGIIGCNYKGNLTLQDCMFDGSITTTEKDGCGGLVGFTEVGGTATATNCLLTATFDLNNNNTNVTLLRHAGYGTVENISNCYYLNGLYVKQGTQVTDEQLANGTIATALQADRDETVWVQDEKTGRPIQSIFYRYGLSKDEEGYYLLASAADWKAFAELVKTTPTANAKMTADIDLGDDQTMVGSLEYPYHGNFDGLGHTLTVNLDSYYTFDKGTVAPFSCVKDATIKNLHVAGSLKQQYCAAGGVAGNIQGNLTVSQCWVSAYIYVQGYGNYQGTIGGIASYCDDPNVRNCEIVIEDCIFSGEFGTGIHSGSIMSHVNGEYGNHAILRNCLNIGTFPSASGNSGTFIRPIQGNSFAIDNCYYRNSFGYIQGSQATDSQLSDGTIATTLQAGRTETVWVQDPDRNCPMLLVFSTSDPDGIRAPLVSPEGEGKAVWYDLSGRKVQKPSKGLYIVNGKKVLVQ